MRLRVREHNGWLIFWTLKKMFANTGPGILLWDCDSSIHWLILIGLSVIWNNNSYTVAYTANSFHSFIHSILLPSQFTTQLDMYDMMRILKEHKHSANLYTERRGYQGGRTLVIDPATRKKMGPSTHCEPHTKNSGLLRRTMTACPRNFISIGFLSTIRNWQRVSILIL